MAKDMSGGMLSRSRELQEAREEDIRRDEALRAVRLEIARLKEENPIPSEKVQEELAERERQREMFQNMQMGLKKLQQTEKVEQKVVSFLILQAMEK